MTSPKALQIYFFVCMFLYFFRKTIDRFIDRKQSLPVAIQTHRHLRLVLSKVTSPLSGRFGVLHDVIQSMTSLSVFRNLNSPRTLKLSLRFAYLTVRQTLPATGILILIIAYVTLADTSSTLCSQTIITSCSQTMIVCTILLVSTLLKNVV